MALWSRSLSNFSCCCTSDATTSASEVVTATSLPNSAVLDSDLCHAARQGNAALVQQILEMRADVNATDGEASKSSNGATPLIIACRHGHLEVAKCLLKRVELDVNCGTTDTVNKTRTGQTAIHWAIRGGHGKLAIQVAEDARTNIEATTQLGFNPLMLAAQTGQLEVVERLIDLKGNVNHNFTVPNKIKCCALRSSIGENFADVVRILLRTNEVAVNEPFLDMNGPETTFLDLAVTLNLPQVVQALLEFRADADKKSSDGYCAFTRAVAEDSGELITMLCLHGADTSAVFTPLQRSQLFGECAKALELHEANEISMTDVFANLHLAVAKGDKTQVDSLLAGFARPSDALKIEDGSFMPAAYYAAELAHIDILVKLLASPHRLGEQKAKQVVDFFGVSGPSTIVAENAFKLVKALLSKEMEICENDQMAHGAFGLVKPFCGSLAALRYFKERPEDFIILRELCRERIEEIYAQIDAQITPVVLNSVATVAEGENTLPTRQDDPGLLPDFKYYINGDNGGQNASGNLEIFAGRTLALIALAVNNCFKQDMLDLFPTNMKVIPAPPKTFTRMFNKLNNPAEHGDPKLKKPRPMRNVDVVRCCTIVENTDDLRSAWDILQSRYRIIRVKNNHQTPGGFGGYRNLLVNFAYEPGVTFREIFGDNGRLDPEFHTTMPLAQDEVGKMWCDYVQTLGQANSWAWSLMPLWRIARLEPDRKIVLGGEVQIVLAPYMVGRGLSHLLYKISRCETGAEEMNRDFGRAGLKLATEEEKRTEGAVMKLAETLRPLRQSKRQVLHQTSMA
mmetsp:Transcript_25457/g.58671  ORF Transcript_25457/g.58671 Transcript_25457/m.58671 type:complete len:797 (-) Transcript_25457:116-2506(-)